MTPQTLASPLFVTLPSSFLAGKRMSKSQKYIKFSDSEHPLLQTDELNTQTAKTTSLLICDGFCQSSCGVVGCYV